MSVAFVQCLGRFYMIKSRCFSALLFSVRSVICRLTISVISDYINIISVISDYVNMIWRVFQLFLIIFSSTQNYTFLHYLTGLYVSLLRSVYLASPV